MSVFKANKSNFESLKQSERPVLLDFYADWCGPCRMVSPVVDEIAKEHPEYLIAKVNIDSEPELAKQFGVYSIPTLVVLRDGSVSARSVGAKNKDGILSLLRA